MDMMIMIVMIAARFHLLEVIVDLLLWQESQHTEILMNVEIHMIPLIGWLQLLHQWLVVPPHQWNVELHLLVMIEEMIPLETFMDVDQKVHQLVMTVEGILLATFSHAEQSVKI